MCGIETVSCIGVRSWKTGGEPSRFWLRRRRPFSAGGGETGGARLRGGPGRAGPPPGGGGGEGGELDRSEGRPETGPPDSRGVLEEAHPRIKTIIIDPGHGGHDPGTVHTWETESGNNVTMQEKEIVLQVSRDIAARLQERFPDREILMTRREDSYPTLQDRVDLANQVELSEAETMLFLSIHVNASFNKKARGYEVWYLPPEVRRTVLPDEQSQGKPQKVIPVLNRMLEEEYSRQSRRLASEILGELDHRVGEQTENRGMKEESWYVVRHARMPAVLLELGFITHEEEAALLRKDAYLKKLASAVYNGIVRYVEGAEY